MLLLTALLSALLVTFSVAPAQAHTPAANPTCTSLDVSATNYGGSAANHVTVVIDGETVVDQAFGANFVRSFAWDATVDHDWEVTIDQGDGNRYDYSDSGTWTACEEPPATETSVTTAPRFQDVCGPDFQLVVPEDTEAYRFTVEDGTEEGAGAIVVTATLEPGYVWTGGSTDPRTWTFHATNEPCDVPTTVEGTPNVVDQCGPGYDVQLPAVTDGDGYAFSVDESGVTDGAGTVVVTATLADGFTWQDGSTEPRTYEFDVTSEPCTTEAIPAPTAAEVCGPEGDAPYVLPADGEHYRYVVTDPGTYTDGERVITIAVAFDEGSVAPEGATTSWTFTFSDQPCDTPVVGIATADVTVTPATCSAPGTATPGETERASWAVTDVPAAGGQATFVAVAEEGAAFEAGLPGVSSDLTTRTFTLDVPAAGGELCTIAPPPVQPPTQGTPPTLPQTGFDISPILLLGALLALAGATLVVRRVRAEA